MMISPSSESHQQVVAVGQPLAVQPQGTVMVKYHFLGYQVTVKETFVPFFVYLPKFIIILIYFYLGIPLEETR